VAECEGYDTLEDLLQAVIADGVSRGICMTEGCSYATEVPPDQRKGWSEVCGKGTAASVLVLAEITEGRGAAHRACAQPASGTDPAPAFEC
jgi:hypothetical protein